MTLGVNPGIPGRPATVPEEFWARPAAGSKPLSPVGLRARLRGGVRLARVGLLTALWYLAWIGGAGLTVRAPALRRRWRRRALRGWARSVARALGFRIAVHGAPPRPPFLLVCNHLSYVDVIVLAAVLDPVFVAKSEVAVWPVLGPLARSIGTIFVDRQVKRDALQSLDSIGQALAQGHGVVVFAEGTSSAGREVLPLRSALLDWPARRSYPVHYASLSYHTSSDAMPAHLAVCWWGTMSFIPHLIELSRVETCAAAVTFGPGPIVDPERKRLARRLHRAIHRQFTPVTEKEAIQP